MDATFIQEQARAYGRFMGRPLLVAGALYVVSTLLFGVLEIHPLGQSYSYWSYGEALARMGQSGGARFLLCLAYLSLLVPYLWQDRRAWLGMGLTLLPLLKLPMDLWSIDRSMRAMMGDWGGSVLANSMSGNWSVFVVWGAALTVCYLALQRGDYPWRAWWARLRKEDTGADAPKGD